MATNPITWIPTYLFIPPPFCNIKHTCFLIFPLKSLWDETWTQFLHPRGRDHSIPAFFLLISLFQHLQFCFLLTVVTLLGILRGCGGEGFSFTRCPRHEPCCLELCDQVCDVTVLMSHWIKFTGVREEAMWAWCELLTPHCSEVSEVSIIMCRDLWTDRPPHLWDKQTPTDSTRCEDCFCSYEAAVVLTATLYRPHVFNYIL